MNSHNPLQIERSKLFTVSTNETSQCELEYTSKKSWELIKYDDSTQQYSINIDLSQNPTSSLNELVVHPNTLSYGLYKFNFTIRIQTVNFTKFNSIQTYIEIIPTGLVIFALPNGISQVLIGSSQSVSLMPSLYSYDIDQIINVSSLIFRFYCKKTNTSSSLVTQSYSNQSLIIRNNQECFGQNINGYTFDINQSSQLNISAKSLSYMGKAISYDFKIETSYMTKIFSQEIRIDIDPSDIIPLASLRHKIYNYLLFILNFKININFNTLSCRFAKMCLPFSKFQIINSDADLILDGSCQDGCPYLTSIRYNFIVYYGMSRNDSLINWLIYDDFRFKYIQGINLLALELVQKNN